MTPKDKTKVPSTADTATDVAAFLAHVKAMPRADADGRRGRLLFALDATASRQPTWDLAAQLQGEMFAAAAAYGTFQLQLCFYRGLDEFKVSPWLSRAEEIRRLMTTVTCRAGRTQLRKVLQHAANAAGAHKLSAIVFVGDCMEEDVDRLAETAGALGVLGVPAFMFQEGGDPLAAFAFREIARLTGGAYHRFDAGSAQTLRQLLAAIAVFAAGGRPALDRLAADRGGDVKRLVQQMKRP